MNEFQNLDINIADNPYLVDDFDIADNTIQREDQQQTQHKDPSTETPKRKTKESIKILAMFACILGILCMVELAMEFWARFEDSRRFLEDSRKSFKNSRKSFKDSSRTFKDSSRTFETSRIFTPFSSSVKRFSRRFDNSTTYETYSIYYDNTVVYLYSVITLVGLIALVCCYRFFDASVIHDIFTVALVIVVVQNLLMSIFEY